MHRGSGVALERLATTSVIEVPAARKSHHRPQFASNPKWLSVGLLTIVPALGRLFSVPLSSGFSVESDTSRSTG